MLNRLLKKSLVCVSVLALSLLGGWGRLAAAADDSKPVAVLSFAGYDRLAQSLDMVGKLSNSALKDLPEMLLKGKKLAELDKSRPWGVAAFLDPTKSYLFLPVTDLKQFAESLGQISGTPLEKVGDAYKIDTPKATLFARQQGKWVIVSLTPDKLSDVPDDPSANLADLPKQYELALCLHVSNVPPDQLDIYLGLLQSGMQVAVQLNSGKQGDPDSAQQSTINELFEKISAAIKDLTDVTVGLATEPTSKELFLDFQYTAKSGSKLAAELAGIKPIPSHFAKLCGPGATLTASVARALSSADVEQALARLDYAQKQGTQQMEEKASLPDAELKKAKQLLGELVDVLKATVKKGQVEFGAALTLQPANSTLIAGGAIAERGKLDNVIRQAVQLARDLAPHPEDVVKAVQLDAGNYKDFVFHKITIPLTSEGKEAEPLTKIVGDKLVILIALGRDSLLVAAGKNPEAALKQAIDNSQSPSAQSVPPLRVSLSLRSLAQFIAGAAADLGWPDAQTAAALLSAALADCGDKDHLRLTVMPVERGVRARYELEEGVLKALGTLTKGLGGGAPGS